MEYYRIILVVLLFSLPFFSCNREIGEEVYFLDIAEKTVNESPERALETLDSILFPEKLDKKLFYKYNLLLIQAKDKCYRDITADTVIFSTKEYFINKKDLQNAALAAFYCGRIRHEQKNIDKAANAYWEANELADKIKDYNLKGLIYGNLGILYYEHSLYEEAIASNKDAVAMYDKAKNYRNKIRASNLIGHCFLLIDQIDSAFYYYNMSLEMADSYNIPESQSNIRQSMGVAYVEKKEYNNAKRSFAEAFSFSVDSVEQARILLNTAKVYVLEEKSDSVKFYLDKALMLQAREPRLMRSSYLLKSKIEEGEKIYQEALESYKEYYNYTMKVFDSERNNKVLELQKKYDFEKIKNSNNILTIKHQQARLLLLLVLLITGAITFIFYWKATQREKLLADLEQKIEGLQEMADNFSKTNQTFRNILLGHFDIIRKTASLKAELSKAEQDSGQKLLRKFNKVVYGQDTLDWNKLYQVMNNLQDGLHDMIKEKYPHLKETEFRLLCLTCEKFDDTEIAIILDKTIPMVRKMRNKIRESIKMPKYTHDFISFLKEDLSTTQ